MQTSTTRIETPRDNHAEIVLRGTPVCPGIGIGRGYAVDREQSVDAVDIAPERIAEEQDRYTAAVKTAIARLQAHIAAEHGGDVPEAEAVLEVHQAILGDESFHNQVRSRMVSDRKNAEWCLWQEASRVIEQFSAMRDPYFSARSEDIRDMADNLIGVLSGNGNESVSQSEREQVFVSRHMLSSDAMHADRSHAHGFVSESRALVSHAAILLKGFDIPAVAGIEGLAAVSHDGDTIIVDGTDGLVIINPTARTAEAYRGRKDASESLSGTAASITCTTADGGEIVLRANIENPGQVKLMLAHGLDGIGLFRTEFLVSPEGGIPSEEEQYRVYRDVIEQAAGRRVTIRTFDIGGDKSMGLSCICTGHNPSLGLRGIRRHLLDRPDELRTQLRAILRAAVGGDVGILIPMVTTVDDIVAAKRHIVAVSEALRAAGTAFSPEVLVGSMIETPAAAAMTGAILSEVDFVSVGTNDLLQYFMAADRDNERVLHYQDGASPAFLWLMEHIIKQARNSGREADVTVCGEVATDTRALPHLLRLGYRSFSVSPVSATLFRGVCTQFHHERRKE
jgi:phosphoenolpyruvate-protein phosphotransferase (PTS system enzyme I)